MYMCVCKYIYMYTLPFDFTSLAQFVITDFPVILLTVFEFRDDARREAILF